MKKKIFIGFLGAVLALGLLLVVSNNSAAQSKMHIKFGGEDDQDEAFIEDYLPNRPTEIRAEPQAQTGRPLIEEDPLQDVVLIPQIELDEEPRL